MKALLLIMFLLPRLASASVVDVATDHSQKTAVGAFDEVGLWILGGGALATIVAFQYDQQIRSGAKDHQSMSASLTKIGEFWGDGIPEAIVLGSQYFFDQEKSIAGIEGLIMGNLVVQALKYSAHRERPDGSENVSFPSGHTQASFSLAMSMTESIGWRKSVPFWLMGVFTGMSRISDDKHWLSDVTAGATIGILFGRAGFAHHLITPTVLFEKGQVTGGALSLRMEF